MNILSFATVEIFIAVATAVGVLVALQQYLLGRSISRQNEVSILRELRSEWFGLREKWYAAILATLGSDDFYSPATQEMRNWFRGVEKALQKAEQEPSSFSARDDAREKSHYFEQAVREITFFLDMLSSSVLSGKLSPRLAYSIVGPEIPRRSSQIRMMLGVVARRNDGRRRFSNSSFPGLTDRVMALMDILWAECARLGDLMSHELIDGAETKKRSGSGRRARARVRRLVKANSGGILRRNKTWFKLDRILLEAEYLTEPNEFDPKLRSLPRRLKRKGFLGFVRKNIEWITGIFRKDRMVKIDKLRLKAAGEHVKNLRKDRGWSIRKLAIRSEVSVKYIRRLEKGGRLNDIGIYDLLLGVLSANSIDANLVHAEVRSSYFFGGFREMGSGASLKQGDSVERFEFNAPDNTFLVFGIPRIMQTLEYAACVGSGWSDDEESIEGLGLEVTLVLLEDSLRWWPGEYSVMLKQIERLIDYSTKENVSIRVIPSSVRLEEVPTHTFNLLGGNILTLEMFTESVATDNFESVSVYGQMIGDLRGKALAEQESVELLKSIKEDLESESIG